MGRTLRAMGIGRRDRVAVVLPNGPELAVAILTVEACAVCVPLNPAYGTEELERSFCRSAASCVDHAGWNRFAGDAAWHFRAASRILELSAALDAEAGLFTLTGDQGGTPR